MKFRKKSNTFLFISCILMMFTLAWFTVSLPFVYAAQTVKSDKSANEHPVSENEDEGDNTFANTTEEKTSNNISSLSEEYLHDSHSSEQYLFIVSNEYKVKEVSTYIAFYGELICPPPDAA